MAFLSGSIAFERFRVSGEAPSQFGPDELEVLAAHSRGEGGGASPETVQVGFLAGGHLFDREFSLEKNVINDALHCGVRIDKNQVPAAIRRAWLQLELAAATADDPERRPTRAERQAAKDAVEQRCDDEARSGKYLRMQQFPVLWDGREQLLYFGGSSPAASGHCADLFERAFELELERISAGRVAENWAAVHDLGATWDELLPATFVAERPISDVPWVNMEFGSRDFLGNEFLLWLWWRLETGSDTLELGDGSEVAVMFTRSLTLECPLGESGKETITAEAPTQLPEAVRAVQSGKLPRKAGLLLARHGVQYQLVLQAESFTVSGARVQSAEDEEGRAVLESRIDAIRTLSETLDLMLHAYCAQRLSKGWERELAGIRQWLEGERSSRRKPAA